MAIQTRCIHCGHTYSARDDWAGKKVRCRQCGMIFPIPASSDTTTMAAPQEDFSEDSFSSIIDPEAAAAGTHASGSVVTSQSNMTGGVGSAKSYMQRPDADPGTFSLAGESGATGYRPSLPFNFPFARELDHFAPAIVAGLMLLWSLSTAYGWSPDEQTLPGWAAGARLVLALLLFVLLWWTLFTGAVRKTANAIRMQLPAGVKRRSAALASIPFTLCALFWLTSGSLVFAGIGATLGVGLSALLAWFLLRLRETDIVYSAIAMLMASAIAVALSAGAILAANLILGQALLAAGKANSLASSPLGPSLSWPQPTPSPPEPPARTKRPVIAIAPATAPTPALPPQTPQEPLIASLLADNPVLKSARILPVAANVVQLVQPLAGDEALAGVMSVGNDHEIELYTLQPFHLANRVTFAGVSQNPTYALSPSGELLSRVSTFPALSIQTWSFKQGRVIDPPVDLSQLTSSPRLLGYISPTDLLYEIRSSQLELRSVNVRTLESLVWVHSAEAHAPIWAFDPKTQRAATVARSGDDTFDLCIYSGASEPDRLPLAGLDKNVALSPSGIAFSPNGQGVALSYERGGQLSIFVVYLPERRIAERHFFPGGLGLNAAAPNDTAVNRLHWLADGLHWIYDGRVIIDIATSQVVSTLNLTSLKHQQLVDGKTLYLLEGAGNRVLELIFNATPTPQTAADAPQPTPQPSADAPPAAGAAMDTETATTP